MNPPWASPIDVPDARHAREQRRPRMSNRISSLTWTPALVDALLDGDFDRTPRLLPRMLPGRSAVRLQVVAIGDETAGERAAAAHR
jgi:hypothetical protein